MQLFFIDSKGTTQTIEGQVGQTLMEAAIKAGIREIAAECGGACSCATCHVYVSDDWTKVVGPAEMMEEDMLDFAFDVRPTSRLSCQITLGDEHAGLTVSTPARQG